MAGTSESPERGGVPAKRSFDEVREEDAATMKASDELKRTTISDKKDEEKENQQGSSPGANAEDKDLKDGISSPKKKRSREEDEKDAKEGEKNRVPSSGSASNSDRADRSEPEKKRPREEGEEDESPADMVLKPRIPHSQQVH